MIGTSYPNTVIKSQNMKIFKRNLDDYLSSSPERMIRFPEEDCGEKILLNAPSGALPTNLQVYK